MIRYSLNLSAQPIQLALCCWYVPVLSQWNQGLMLLALALVTGPWSRVLSSSRLRIPQIFSNRYLGLPLYIQSRPTSWLLWIMPNKRNFWEWYKSTVFFLSARETPKVWELSARLSSNWLPINGGLSQTIHPELIKDGLVCEGIKCIWEVGKYYIVWSWFQPRDLVTQSLAL